MNSPNKNKIFLAIIAILLITNIAMIVIFLQKKGGDKPAERPDRKTIIANFLQQEIGFNRQQLLQYDTLSNRHREKIGTLYDTIRSNKNEQFKQLVAGNFSDSSINVAADQSAASQKKIDVVMFGHFKNIRMLCTPEQRPRFDSLFIKVFNRKGDGRKKNTK